MPEAVHLLSEPAVMAIAVIADIGVGVRVVAGIAGEAAADVPRVAIFLDIDRARLLGEQAAKDKPAYD